MTLYFQCMDISASRDFMETNLITPALVKACRKTNKLQNPQRLKGLLMNWILSSSLPSDDFQGNSIYSKRSYLNDKHGPILLKYLAKITVDSTGCALYQTVEPNQLAVPGKLKWKQQNQWDVGNRRNQQGPVGLPRNLPHGMLLMNSSSSFCFLNALTVAFLNRSCDNYSVGKPLTRKWLMRNQSQIWCLN